MRSNKRKKTFQINSEKTISRISKAHTKMDGPSALNLIEFRRDKLVLNEEALQEIKNIKDDLIIIFIFGKEKTGKSFLMDLLINSKTKHNIKISNSLISTKDIKGFKVNSTFNTLEGNKRGIYFWSAPIEKEKSSEKLLFFDSEGINSENIYQQTLESKLLALMIIISSLFIYNTSGDIDSNSLNNLQFIGQLTDSINIEGKIDKDEVISELSPKFIWTLRDFDKEKYKKVKKKNDIYLEECLNDDRFTGKNNDEMNMIKESLVKYFKKRECVIMPCPVNNEKELPHLKKMYLDELNDDFQDQFHVLKKKVYETSQAKLINSKKINGPILVYLLKLFINEINNSEENPNINKIFTDLLKYELELKYNTAKNDFKKKLDRLKKEEDIDIKEIYHIKYEAINDYMKILEKIPEIYNKINYMKEYEIIKEKLENELEKMIKTELDILTSDISYEKLLDEKQDINNNGIKEAIDDYLNILIGLKMDMTDTILNKKDFENFIINDLKRTNDIINHIKKEKDENIENINNKEKEENNINNEDDINKIKLELEKVEKEELELTGTYTQLLEKKNKSLKNSLRSSKNYGKHSIRSYSSKLVSVNIKEEKSCDLSDEDKKERCNCNLGSLNNCNLF